MTFQVVLKIAEEDPEFWEEFERTSIRKIYWPYKDSLSHKRDCVNESGEYPLAVFTPLEFCVHFARWRQLQQVCRDNQVGLDRKVRIIKSFSDESWDI